jgi:hypothetical protein
MTKFEIPEEDLKRIKEHTNMLKNSPFNKGMEELERREKESKL